MSSHSQGDSGRQHGGGREQTDKADKDNADADKRQGHKRAATGTAASPLIKKAKPDAPPPKEVSECLELALVQALIQHIDEETQTQLSESKSAKERLDVRFSAAVRVWQIPQNLKFRDQRFFNPVAKKIWRYEIWLFRLADHFGRIEDKWFPPGE